MSNLFEFQATHIVEPVMIMDIMTDALDTPAMACWASGMYFEPPEEEDWSWLNGLDRDRLCKEYYKHLVLFMAGGRAKVVLHEEFDDQIEYFITREDIKSALKNLAEKNSRHFRNIMTGDPDGETADMLMQYAIFGECVFG